MTVTTVQWHQPLQERAIATRNRILDATRELLQEEGIEAITTNAIARRGGVNIASLYKYFPDKYAILRELALAFADKQSRLICEYLRKENPNATIETVCGRMVDAVIEGTRNDLALVQLQRALIVFPELLSAYRETNLDIGDAMTPFLRRWGIVLSKSDLAIVMKCLGEAFGALQDLALSRHPTYDPRVVRELKFLLTAYYKARAARQE